MYIICVCQASTATALSQITSAPILPSSTFMMHQLNFLVSCFKRAQFGNYSSESLCKRTSKYDNLYSSRTFLAANWIYFQLPIDEKSLKTRNSKNAAHGKCYGSCIVTNELNEPSSTNGAPNHNRQIMCQLPMYRPHCTKISTKGGGVQKYRFSFMNFNVVKIFCHHYLLDLPQSAPAMLN